MADALAKSFQARQGAVLGALVQDVVCVQSRCQPDHFFKAVYGLYIAFVQAAHNHVEAVRTQVYSGNNFRWFDRHGRSSFVSGVC